MRYEKIISPSLGSSKGRIPEPHEAVHLDRLGTACFKSFSATHTGSGNRIWTGTGGDGERLFLKQLLGRPAEERLLSAMAFEEYVSQLGDIDIAPRHLGSDAENSALLFEALPDVHDGRALADASEFWESHAHAAGLLTRRLHSLEGAGATLPTQPAAPVALALREVFEGVPEQIYTDASGAEVESWRVVQRDHALAGAITELFASSRPVPRVPTHGALRLEHMLFREQSVHFTDWTEFGLADPARDIARFVSEFLLRAVRKTRVCGEDDSTGASIERVLRELEYLRPLVVAFWRAYLGGRVDPDLIHRSVAHSGVYLLESVLFGVEGRELLHRADRAALTLGRVLVITPSAFANKIGLESVE